MADEPCLHCLVHELIQEHFLTEAGELDVLPVVMKLIEVIADIVADAPTDQMRARLIARVATALPELVADKIGAHAEAEPTLH